MIDTIKFYLHWEEYFAAQEFFRRSRQTIDRFRIWGGLLALLGVFVFFLGGWGIYLGAYMFLVGVNLLIGAHWVRRWVSKRKWEREPLYQSEHEVTFSEDGVYFRMGPIESNLDWMYYQRLIESPDGLLLVYGNDSFNLLPKRAFANELLLNKYRALAQKKLK
jgi:hypothetical protein